MKHFKWFFACFEYKDIMISAIKDPFNACYWRHVIDAVCFERTKKKLFERLIELFGLNKLLIFFTKSPLDISQTKPFTKYSNICSLMKPHICMDLQRFSCIRDLGFHPLIADNITSIIHFASIHKKTNLFKFTSHV